MKYFAFLVLFHGLTLLGAPSALAEEGMWTLDNLPRQALKESYGFEPSQAWIDAVMKSSVNFGGASGSFVSSDGLVLTNHHVASDALERLSTPEKDYYRHGFLARTRLDELVAPGTELKVLQSMKDVTARVKASVQPGMSPDEAEQARRKEILKIEKESTETTGLQSRVVSLYQGGRYQLHLYKIYTDVRLVFAPEFDAAFFGGDPDNFEFPRYDLDMALFRVYENGLPAHIDHFLRWSGTGAQEDELVFVSGHPGRTSRILTLAALEGVREEDALEEVESRRLVETLLAYSSGSEEAARQAQGMLFGVQNWRKKLLGEFAGLKDRELIEQKRKKETEIRAAVALDPKLAPLGAAWTEIERVERAKTTLAPAMGQLEGNYALSSSLFWIARQLVRIAEEDQKPDSERLPEYQSSKRESLLRELLVQAPIYENLEREMLRTSLETLQLTIGAESPLVRKVLAAKSPQSRAYEAMAGTSLFQVEERERLLRGGVEAIRASQDSMIVFAREIDPDCRTLRSRFKAEVKDLEDEAYPKIAEALFALFGTTTYPDANGTLRLSFGTVKGYTEPNGTAVRPWTTLGETFEYERSRGAQPPYRLPESWHRVQSALNPATRFNFVSTNDIIGGNSGSPVINRSGELVGLIFDGNIHSLTSSFIYDGRRNRAVSVHSSAMLEALRTIYGARELADELGK